MVFTRICHFFPREPVEEERVLSLLDEQLRRLPVQLPVLDFQRMFRPIELVSFVPIRLSSLHRSVLLRFRLPVVEESPRELSLKVESLGENVHILTFISHLLQHLFVVNEEHCGVRNALVSLGTSRCQAHNISLAGLALGALLCG